jgi:hypothetical protein
VLLKTPSHAKFLRMQSEGPDTHTHWVERMTTLARLMRTLTGYPADDDGNLDCEKQRRPDDDKSGSLLADLNRRPLISWQVSHRHIQLIELARTWPGLGLARERSATKMGERMEARRGAEMGEREEDEDGAAAALRAAGRVGDCTWEDACVGEIAGLLLLEGHVCMGAGDEGSKGGERCPHLSSGGGEGSEAGGEKLVSDFPVLWSLAMALARHAANEFVQGVLLRLRGMSSLRR